MSSSVRRLGVQRVKDMEHDTCSVAKRFNPKKIHNGYMTRTPAIEYTTTDNAPSSVGLVGRLMERHAFSETGAGTVSNEILSERLSKGNVHEEQY